MYDTTGKLNDWYTIRVEKHGSFTRFRDKRKIALLID